jgi:hypothetical protein
MKGLSERKVSNADVSRFLRQVFSDESKEIPVFAERAAATTNFCLMGRGGVLSYSRLKVRRSVY